MASLYNMRHIQLVTERPVEQFLLRLFLRDADMRSLCIVSPFISSMADCRFSLADLRLSDFSGNESNLRAELS